MSLPKEPRQLMINLMYLVLTALLALNVSNEILRAFSIVDNSILASNLNIENKNDATMAALQELLNDPKMKASKKEQVQKAMDLAVQARQVAENMTNGLKSYKGMIIERAGGINAEDGKIKKESDLEAASGVMIHDKNGSKMKGELIDYKRTMGDFINNLEPDMQISEGGDFARNLPLNFDVEKSDDNPSGNWSYANFNMVPAVAATTIVDKYMNDVRNTESAVLEGLWAAAIGEKLEDPFKKKPNKKRPKRRLIKPVKRVFYKYDLLMAAENSYVLPGEKVKVHAMLGAYNPREKGLRISINGRPVKVTNGVAEYTTGAVSSDGNPERTITATAQYWDSNRKSWVTVPKKQIKYYVGQPNAAISLDKMNVFYYGLDNPITISASGIPANRIQINPGPNIRVVKQPSGTNKYFVNPTKFGGTTTLSITGTLSDGSKKTFGPFKYRLKQVPDPVPEIARKRVKFSIPVNALKAQQAIFAKLDNFPYDLEWDVVSFEAFYVPRRGQARPGNSRNKYLNDRRANPTIKSIMDDLDVGDRVIFENIKARMRNGKDPRTRNIGNISITCPN